MNNGAHKYNIPIRPGPVTLNSKNNFNTCLNLTEHVEINFGFHKFLYSTCKVWNIQQYQLLQRKLSQKASKSWEGSLLNLRKCQVGSNLERPRCSFTSYAFT
jgi:hypothetical protein